MGDHEYTATPHPGSLELECILRPQLGRVILTRDPHFNIPQLELQDGEIR